MVRLAELMASFAFLVLLGVGFRCVAGDLAATATSDPFAYCSRMGSIDEPEGGASPIPIALEPYLARALGLSAQVRFNSESYYWRCMNDAVYVCAIGANIPCDAKADRTKRNSGADKYCEENREAAVVPAYATGHATVYGWSCSAGKAVRGKRTAKVDRRGYRIDIWHRVLH
jgi:hypothetical protein